jgi:hypothetical protein
LGGAVNTALVTVLADRALVSGVVGIATPLVTDFLGQPAVVGALGASVGQITTAIAGGTDPNTALQTGLTAFLRDPAVGPALRKTAGGLVSVVLGEAAVRSIAALAAASVAVDVVRSLGIDSQLIDVVAAHVTTAAVASLLNDKSIVSFVGDAASELLVAESPTAAVNSIIQSALTNWQVQEAIGTAVGQGFGSLFGDNPVGVITGWAAGATATVAIQLAAQVLLFFGGVRIPAAPLSASSVVAVDPWAGGRLVALGSSQVGAIDARFFPEYQW